MVTRITRMQRKKKKKQEKSTRFPSISRPRSQSRNSSHRCTPPRYWNSIPTKFFLLLPLEKDGVDVVDRDLPRFSLIFPEHASAFFLLPFLFFLPVLFKTGGRSRKGTISLVVPREIPRTKEEKSNGREGKGKSRQSLEQTGPGVHRISS